MSAADLSHVAFAPLARAPAWPKTAPVQGVRLCITHRDSQGAILRFTIGADAQAALDALEGQRVSLAFADQGDDKLVLIRRVAAGQRSGSTLTRHNGSPSLRVQFASRRTRLPRQTFTTREFVRHPDGGLVIVLTGEVVQSVSTFQAAAALVANAVREAQQAKLEAAR